MSPLDYNDEAARRLHSLYMTPDIIAQRDETLRLLALQSGETVVDIGSGPGLLCDAMADAVGPTGRVIGIDISDDLLMLARARNARTWLSYEKGDATSLPIPASSVDIAVATQVIEYVADVNRALSEVERVLKPGGRALIVDTDWDGVVWHSSSPERMESVLQAWEAHCSHPRLPRTMPRRLRAAGLEVQSVTGFAIVNTRFDDRAYSAGLARFIDEFVCKQESLANGEIRGWLHDLEALSSRDEYFFSTTRHFFAARKPRQA